MGKKSFDGTPEKIFPCTGLCRKGKNRQRRTQAQSGSMTLQRFSLIALGDLIDLGNHNQETNSRSFKPGLHLEIQIGGRMAGIQQQDDATELSALFQIVLNGGSPARLYVLRDPGISITRQIHEVKGLIDPKEIYQPCLSRGGTDPGNPPLPQQGIDD